MPELKFHEEEPERTIPVMPTISRQEEILAAVSDETLQAPPVKVRYGDWHDPDQKVRFDSMRIPNWMFVAASAAIWVAIGVMFLLPQIYLPAEGFPSGRIPIPNSLLGLAIVLVGELLLCFIWTIQMIRDRVQYRRRVPAEEKPTLSPGYVHLGPGFTGMGIEVGASFQQDGFLYATDRGYLRLEDDSLYFEGAKTSFSISKSRLRLRPLHSSHWSMFLKGDLHPALTVLSYAFEGTEYQFAFANMKPGLGFERARARDRLVTWLNLPSEPAEFEVLFPKTVPPEAAREALDKLKIPALAGQGLLFLGGMGLYVLKMDFDFHAKWPHTSGLGPGIWVVPLLIGLEVAAIGAFGVVLPIVRGLKRYRFLRDRLN